MEQLTLFHRDECVSALSYAEIQLAREVAKSKSNKQIAATLGKSEKNGGNTVKKH